MPFILLAVLACASRSAAEESASPIVAEETPAAKDSATATPASPEDEGADATLFRATLPLDIATASFYDLVAWARSLGLSEAGSAAELRQRLYEHYGVAAPTAAGVSGTVVTIERAASATYFTLDEEGGIVRASGGVKLTITEKDGSTHSVEADEIAYDRERRSFTARGSVRYERKSGTATEIFSGEALSANLDDWSGVFLDGKVRRSGEGAKEGDRGLSMTAETMIKRSGDVLILEKGVITACDEDDPHYAIRAGKVWLLGDKEWAIADAVFSVGNIPVLWLPFFYYPGDELVFHPVFGYRSREGTYVQTTTYLIGQKPKQSESTSILSFANQGTEASGPMVLKGLFLHRVAGEAPAEDRSLKVMLDAYSGLGAFAGLAGSLPKTGPFEKLDFSLGFGLSRSLFDEGTVYSPYDAAGDYESVWNKSEFLGYTLPLRFGLDLSGTLRAGIFSSTFSLPLLSDCYFDEDFKDRSEDMDWVSLLSSNEDSDDDTSLTRTSLSQRVDITFNLSPKSLSPWLSSFSVTRLGSSMSWSSASRSYYTDETSTLYSVDPTRLYFYPSLLRPIDVALSLKGSLLGPSSESPKLKDGEKEGQSSTEEATPKAPELRSPWIDGNEEEEEGTASTAVAAPASEAKQATDEGGGASEAASALEFRLPKRAPSSPTTESGESWSTSIDWNLTPSAYLEDSYRSKLWSDPSDIDFALLYSLISYKIAAGIDASSAYRKDRATASLSFAYADQNQYRNYLYDEDPYVDKAEALKLADYQYKSRKLTGSLRLGAKPFASSWLWSATSLSYSLDATIYKLKYSELVDDEPVYDESTFAWDDDNITTHSAGLTLAVRPWGLSQSLGLTMSLPPTTESYSAKLSLDGGPLDLVVQDRMYRSSPSDSFSFDSATASLTVSSDPWPSFANTLTYDVEDGSPVSNVMTFSWGPFSSSLTMKDSQAYQLSDTGWEAVGSESFRPSALSMTLKGNLKSREGARSTWSVGTNAVLSQSLLRFSESTLTLGLTASLKVSKLIELSFSSQSQNSAAWRYYPELFSSSTTLSNWPDAYKRSFFEDVVDSLSVWDTDALHRGLFKLKSLSFKMTHDLHDWDLSVEMSVSPLLKTTPTKRYVLDPELSILLKWRDISAIKTEATYDSDDGFTY